MDRSPRSLILNRDGKATDFPTPLLIPDSRTRRETIDPDRGLNVSASTWNRETPRYAHSSGDVSDPLNLLPSGRSSDGMPAAPFNATPDGEPTSTVPVESNVQTSLGINNLVPIDVTEAQLAILIGAASGPFSAIINWAIGPPSPASSSPFAAPKCTVPAAIPGLDAGSASNLLVENEAKAVGTEVEPVGGQFSRPPK